MHRNKTRAIVNKGDIQSLKKSDNIFISIADKYGDPPNWKLEPGFVSLDGSVYSESKLFWVSSLA